MRLISDGGVHKLCFFGYLARCINPECGVHTRFFQYELEAILAWNRRTELKEEAIFMNPFPLTLKKTFLLVPHCPLCGGVAHIRTPSFGWICEVGKFSIICKNEKCGFTTREHGELLHAVEEWNRRI